MKNITWTPKKQKLSILKEWEKNPRSITGEALGRWQRYTKRTAECLTRPEAVIIDV